MEHIFRNIKNGKKRDSFFVFVSVAIVCMGCRVVKPDSRAVLLNLAFNNELDYPFFTYTGMLERKQRDDRHFLQTESVSQIPECSLSLDEIEYYENNGYKKQFELDAAFLISVSSHEHGPWQQLRLYDLDYSFNKGLMPHKTERYSLDVADVLRPVVIIDDQKAEELYIKVLAISTSSLFKSRYFISRIRRPEGKSQQSGGSNYWLFFNYTVFYPYVTINAPPWEEWHYADTP